MLIDFLPRETNCQPSLPSAIINSPLWRLPGDLRTEGRLCGSGEGQPYFDKLTAAETVTFAVAVRAETSMSVAVTLWLPAAIKVTPFGNVWDPASFAVNR